MPVSLPAFKNVVVTALLFMLSAQTFAQGHWTAVADTAPNLNNGVMLLLTDGSVITITINDPNAVWDDSAGPVWNKLTPDSTGSYVNGKWSVIAPMHQSRIYFSSQVLQNGKVYVCGGEFGTGSGAAELYDPLADTWTPIPGVLAGNTFADANSQMLPDGTVLQNSVYSNGGQGVNNTIYRPDSNDFISAPDCPFNDDEATWLKLPDNSILYEGIGSSLTYRYIPALGNWVDDAPVPVVLYDIYGEETGPGEILPDRRAIFFGSNGYTVYYTPTGNSAEGSFTVGSPLPNNLGMPDAPSAMMADGHILLALAPVPNGVNVDSLFHPITYYYDFDYTTNTYTPLPAPGGGQTLNQPSCSSIMLCLPDGNVLYGVEGSSQYYIYTPGNPPLAQGKPTIDSITLTDCVAQTYMVTGTLFNGISQGACFGDDWQMATNYPMVRLVTNGKTYYARTTGWNRTGMQTGTLPDTAYFTLPQTLAYGSYSLLLSANGISSDTVSFTYAACPTGIQPTGNGLQVIKAVPNPGHTQTTLWFTSDIAGTGTLKLTDVLGRPVLTQTTTAVAGLNKFNVTLQGLATGVYTATLTLADNRYITQVVVQ